MIRAVLLGSASRRDEVEAWGCKQDPRVGALSTRWISLRNGHPLVPPGSLLVGDLEAIPKGFFEELFVDPEISPRHLRAHAASLAQRLSPDAHIIASPAQRKALKPRRPWLMRRLIEKSVPNGSGADWADLESWLAARAQLITDMIARDSLAGLARLDDLALEALETHADRLFGQPRRKVLAVPGAEPARGNPWQAVADKLQETRALDGGPEASAWPDKVAGTHKRLAIDTQRAIALAQVLTTIKPDVRTVNLFARDWGIMAVAIAEALSPAVRLVRQVDRSLANLGPFIILYREWRALVGSRIVFRWLPEDEAAPDCDLVVLAHPPARMHAAIGQALQGLAPGSPVMVAGSLPQALAEAARLGAPERVGDCLLYRVG